MAEMFGSGSVTSRIDTDRDECEANLFVSTSCLDDDVVICDERHFVERCLLGSSACFWSRIFGAETDDVEMAPAAGVVDPLVALANAAPRSESRHYIFDRYPSVVDPGESNRLDFDPTRRDFHKVQTVLDCILNAHATVFVPSDGLKKRLDKISPLAFPLLKWIVASLSAS